MMDDSAVDVEFFILMIFNKTHEVLLFLEEGVALIELGQPG